MACTTYHLAKPAQGHKHHLRPRLVTQLQRYGADGRLCEVLEFMYANWWAARASPRLRAFLKPGAPAPGFFLSREAATGLCGAVIIGCGGGATLCCGALSLVFLRNGENLYRLVGSGGRDGAVWTWAPSRQGASEVEFKLTVGADGVVLGTLSRRCIEVPPHCSLTESEADMVLLSGVWLARCLGWIS